MPIDKARAAGRLLASLLGLASSIACAKANGPPLDFFVGAYALVGQEPDGGTTYHGSAKIDLGGAGLLMTRVIGGRSTVATGAIEVPSPPGEGQVLRFRWTDGAAVVMTCLNTTDLDNYPRLTCLWEKAGTTADIPGMEALFPTANWQPQ